MIDKQFDDLPKEFKDKLTMGDKIYEIESTPKCLNGTSGRVAVIEAFEIDKDIESIILKSPTEPELYKAVRSKGMISMKEDAILKAFNKVIPFEEINTL